MRFSSRAAGDSVLIGFRTGPTTVGEETKLSSGLTDIYFPTERRCISTTALVHSRATSHEQNAYPSCSTRALRRRTNNVRSAGFFSFAECIHGSKTSSVNIGHFKPTTHCFRFSVVLVLNSSTKTHQNGRIPKPRVSAQKWN